jgi:hypothetical protein
MLFLAQLDDLYRVPLLTCWRLANGFPSSFATARRAAPPEESVLIARYHHDRNALCDPATMALVVIGMVMKSM